MNNVGRPSAPNITETHTDHPTFTGNKALQINEPLLFEVGSVEQTGVDIAAPRDVSANRLGGLDRDEEIGLYGLSEPQTMRHYVRLSQKNFAIDSGMYPLGSCTMKHNPRINEKIARLPGLADIHPLQPQQTVRGAIEVIENLADWLMKLTGMAAVAMSPKAGAHGELCGMMAIEAALRARGEATKRTKVLIPESAHGTNPATAVFVGYQVQTIKTRDDGTVDPATIREALSDEVAAIMLTNPNTCGLFERDIMEIADAVHEAGAYFYCDGANFNAIMGRARPGDLGVDAMHINLHKTFSTPHGGGGPGAGPVVLSEALAKFAPVPFVHRNADDNIVSLVEHKQGTQAFGRMTAFHGQMGMNTRALAYILSHGQDGIKQAAEDAVLNANYVKAKLKDVLTPSFEEQSPGFKRPAMHEALFQDDFLKDTGITTLDFAKAMIDEGFHPMTMYFPLVVHGAMLIEPTESESKDTLDQFIATMRDLAKSAQNGETERFLNAPFHAPMRRLDETLAARKPILKWTPNAD
ncbi:MAG: aminomethyl-transferring glycine dehydrogenase subunit GcvPB [Rhizobiales bacterium]|nr:aminomethyl-transferring glycine dehydrogenase subunit GcvPB [Hyphomicrobiales bacterium]NRB13511.1 aminomethyl-transferring glycine dehydrogenase subunit GcvPB [Hyphomicrobiales bacterium]